MKAIIVIPAYNEAKILCENTIKAYEFFVRELGDYDWRLVIANNASTDGSLEIADALADEYKRIEHRNIKKKGRGNALKEVWNEYDADVYAYMDADLATDLRHVPEMLALVRDGAHVAVGNRLSGSAQTERDWFRSLASKAFNRLIHRYLPLPVADAQCGFKAISRKVRDEIVPKVNTDTFDSWFFDTELVYRAAQAGLTVKEFPIEWVEDRVPGRKSTVKVFSTAVDYLKQMRRLRRERIKN